MRLSVELSDLMEMCRRRKLRLVGKTGIRVEKSLFTMAKA
jgi:hypothetical protein